MPRTTWKDVDERRQRLRKAMSRAEMCRLAGVSESAATKGIDQGRAVSKGVREKLELVLAAAETMQEATDRHMEALGSALERRLAQ